MPAKFNGTTKLIMIVITAVSITFGIAGGIYGRSNTSMNAKVSKIEDRQNRDHTKILLLEQKIDRIDKNIDRIDKNVSDIHKIIYVPKL